MTSALAWASDVHFNFVDAKGRQEFYHSVANARVSGLLIGGDIGEASSLIGYLKEMSSALPGMPVYFVLGNHDFYGSSVERVRKGVGELENPNLFWLTGSACIDLGDGAALIGDDGWADGRVGNWNRSQILLNDYLRIADFIPSLDDKQARLATLQRLSDEAATRVRAKLEDACRRGHDRILFLTHVPPFREACWHEGALSGNEWLPHFASKVMGETLVGVMDRYPEKQLTVLCGHTHSPGVAQIRPNVLVKTARSVYGEPAIHEVVTI